MAHVAKKEMAYTIDAPNQYRVIDKKDHGLTLAEDEVRSSEIEVV